MPIPSCQEAKMPVFLVPGAKVPGFQVPGIWQYGVILYAREAIWPISSLFQGSSVEPKHTENHQKSSFVASMLPHSQNVTKVYYLLYLHYVGICAKNIKKSIFCNLEIDILGVSVHILASWSATMPIPSCQDAKMPAFLAPGTSLPGILVPGIWQRGVILLRARGQLANLVGFPWSGGNAQNH